MKRWFTLCAVLLCLMALPGAAQDEEMEGSDEYPYALIMSEKYHPGMYDEYREATKQWIAWMKEENMQMMFFAWTDSRGMISYGVPLKSVGAVEEHAAAWAQAAEAMRDTDWGKTRQKAIDWFEYTIWYYAKHASYEPAEPSLSMEEAMYYKAYDFRVTPGKEGAFNAALAKMKAWHEEKGIDRPYYVYRNIIGEKGALYTLQFYAKNPADMYEYEQSVYVPMWEEIKPIIDELDDATESLEEITGWMANDLSMMPQMPEGDGSMEGDGNMESEGSMEEK